MPQNDLLQSPTGLTAERIESLSDESLISVRNEAIAQRAEPEKALPHHSFITPLIQAGVMGIGFVATKTIAPMKKAGEFAKGLVHIGVPAIAGMAAGIGIERNLRKKYIAEKTLVSDQNITGLNAQIEKRTGISADELGLQPITAADLARMKEAHQSRKPVTHVDQINETQNIAQAASR